MAVNNKDKNTITANERTQEAIEKASQKTSLTYEELDKLLPPDATAEEIDEVMLVLSDTDVQIVDEFKIDAEKSETEKKNASAAKKAELRKEAAHSKLERADDPVRMYLREMGRVPLLTKDQEIAIAKRIEAAEKELTEVLLGTPYT
ncbi:MAG TPA: RNA polymerase sigma factor RpoD, partial [Candidatus Hydrogenedentes bacterium]|nr:RNA polymerase sigma factor RpoD [Candidatus Hydrogenedentota bacterium]